MSEQHFLHGSDSRHADHSRDSSHGGNALKARLASPPKTPDNSSLPPSKDQKSNQPDRDERKGPRQGSLGRKGGDRPLTCEPDETVTAKALFCVHCQISLDDTNQVLHGRYDKIGLPPVRRTRHDRLRILPQAIGARGEARSAADER